MSIEIIKEEIADTFILPPEYMVIEVHAGNSAKPKGFCTKCGYNWAALHTQDEEGDESYDACPLCKTDMFLEDFKTDKEAFILNIFNGDIKNITTGEMANPHSDYIEYEEIQEPKPFDREAYEKMKDHKQALHDLALEEYQNVFALNGPQNAEAAFFNKIQELKKVR